MTLKMMLFTREGCGACDEQRAVWDQVKREARAEAQFRDIDMESGADAVEHYRVEKHPTIVLERNGHELQRWTEPASKEELLAALREHREPAQPRAVEVPSGPAGPGGLPPPPGSPRQPLRTPPGGPAPPPPR